MLTIKIIAMTTPEIAKRLAELCKSGEWETAQRELYAEDVVSIEPYPTEDFQKETKGLQAIIEKGRKFDSMVGEVHSLNVSEPMVVANTFAFVLTMDVTMKGKGRMAMDELCVYVVKDDKIISEQFYV
jgi:ketosteroid isomerase-like protein